MTADLFGTPELVPGFQYRADVLSPKEEDEMLGWLPNLPFRAFEFHGFEGKRRVVSFGWKYDFSVQRLFAVDPLPVEFAPVLQRVSGLFGIEEGALQQLLVTEYSPGAAIGWHKDKAEFGKVAGVSLGAACTIRLRQRRGTTWVRHDITLEPRSAYLLTGEVRTDWEHSIPPVKEPRFSLTFRTLASYTGTAA